MVLQLKGVAFALIGTLACKTRDGKDDHSEAEVEVEVEVEVLSEADLPLIFLEGHLLKMVTNTFVVQILGRLGDAPDQEALETDDCFAIQLKMGTCYGRTMTSLPIIVVCGIHLLDWWDVRNELNGESFLVKH